jgi:hypothetical protein
VERGLAEAGYNETRQMYFSAESHLSCGE